MYRLMISFSGSKEDKFGLAFSQPKEYILENEYEVCKVLRAISHLSPIVTLMPVSVKTADEVLVDFDAKEV